MSDYSDEIKEKQKKYVLQSWNAQKNLNPIPIEHCDNIYLYDYDRLTFNYVHTLEEINMVSELKEQSDNFKENVKNLF